MLLTTLILSVCPALTPFDECEYCKPNRACSVHAEEDRKTIRGFEKAWKEAGEEARVAALESVAALTKAHENHRSKDVAIFLADALEDDAAPVRAAAARLLADGQNVDIAVKELTGALSSARRSLQKAVQPAIDAKCEHCSDDEACEVHAKAGLEEGARDAAAALIRALGQLRDDRVAKALQGFLSKTESEPYAPHLRESGVVAMVELGRQDGILWSAETLASMEDTVAAERAATELARAISAHDSLELETPPDGADATAWSAWLRENAKSFPKRLGKLQ